MIARADKTYLYCMWPTAEKWEDPGYYAPSIDGHAKIGTTHSLRDRASQFCCSSSGPWVGDAWLISNSEKWEVRLLEIVEESRISHLYSGKNGLSENIDVPKFFDLFEAMIYDRPASPSEMALLFCVAHALARSTGHRTAYWHLVWSLYETYDGGGNITDMLRFLSCESALMESHTLVYPRGPRISGGEGLVVY